MFLVSVCSKAAATQTGSTRHLRTPAVHSPSVRIQHLLRFRWTRIVVANILFPTLNLFPTVAQWDLRSRRRAFPQHKRLWRIARKIYSIYAAISLHSSHRQRLHQTKAAQISQCHPNSWQQMAMISLPWLLKHKTFPVKTSSVPMCSNFPSAKRQCPSCSVKRHLNI